MSNKTYIIKGLIICAAAAMLSTFKGKYNINMSSSEAIGLYSIERDKLPQKGDLVLLKVPSTLQQYIYGRGWLPSGWPLLKRVGGIEGDRYCYSQSVFIINDNYIGEIFSHDSKGLPLPKMTGCYKVKTDNFLPVATGLISSFDSRYFGEISTKYIEGIAKPIITF